MTRLPLRVITAGLAGLVAGAGLTTTPAAAAIPDPPVPGVPQLHLRPGPEARTFDAARADLDWGPCLGAGGWRIRCAMLAVPLDHDDPSGEVIRLAVSRVKHTVPKRKYRGVILVNPGGPGGSGLDFATIGSVFPAKVRKSYDWIGFDPRGVGSSEPALSCDPDYFGFDRPDYFPRPKANKQAWLQRSRGYADDCRANGDLLRHMTTADSAKDMEALRLALGVRRINYYGFSYGTYLGQVYSTLFPNRLRRAVFDSNVDPRDVFYQSNLDQNPAMDRILRRWFAWIADHRDVYGLGRTKADVRRRFVRTERRLADRPAAGKVGPAEWIDLFLPVAYGTDSWTYYAKLWSKYRDTGRGQLLVRAYRGSGALDGDNSYAVYNAVQCTDAPWPTAWSTWAKGAWRSYDKAPLTSWMNTWFNAPCLAWPVSPRSRFHVDGHQVRGGPLLVGGTLDGATPFAGSKAVKTIFPRSRLLAIQGEMTHAASLNGNRCVLRIVSQYLASGDLPRRLPGKQPDVRCPAQPLPDPTPRSHGLG